jgi:hypothetical protein
MASDAFTQGGVGEVPISVVLAAMPKSFWTLEERKVQADLYESKNPGVTVRRDWETNAEHAARVKVREAMERPAPPTSGMDPSRARPELQRQQQFLAGLSIDHPDYEKLFDAVVPVIHSLEDTCGLQRTEYVKGKVPKKEKETADPALIAKLAEYFKRNNNTRRMSIEKTKDVGFLVLIRDNETLPDLQMLAVQRIEQVRANP